MVDTELKTEHEVREELDEKLRLARAERYYCQSVARVALPGERVSICLRNRIRLPKADAVEDIKVWKHRKTLKAFFSGLMVCGSVWTCPVCAAKISERRRNELKTAFDLHKKDGGYIALLTLTFSHKKFDRLEDILSAFAKATKKFMSGKSYQNIRDEMGLIGRVRALEVTYGVNGFHPHAHIALFYTQRTDLEYMEKKMYDLWEKACDKFDLKVNSKYGLKLENGRNSDEYIAKHGRWGLDQELSKAHIKKPKDGSLQPFDFLKNYLATEDEKYLILFREYAEHFKGKRQLQWSRGLKKRFTLEEKTDDELAKEKTEEADLLGLIDYDVWKKILKNNHRSYFLDLCEKNDFEEALNIVTSCFP
ncbi:TPA: protein rep, partial [Bacillus cereus]|nr:protein rep [Bacillus cereus]